MPKPSFYRMPKDKRERLLEAALEEFAANGYQKGSQNHIIHKAGISKPSLYYYLGGKADLFAAVVATVVNQLYEIVRQKISSTTPEEYWENLKAAIAEISRYRFDRRYNRIFRDFNDPAIKEEIAPYLGDVEKIAKKWVLEIINTGVKVGAFEKYLPTELMANFLISTFENLEEWLATRMEYVSEDELPLVSGAYLELLRGRLDHTYLIDVSRLAILHEVERRRISEAI